MKTTCEIVVQAVLPAVRREVARELVERHRFTQAEVARMFGVTDAAISQYLKARRGVGQDLETTGRYEEFRAEAARSADAMAQGSTFPKEACRICVAMREAGIIPAVYELRTGIPMPECSCAGLH